MLYPHLMCILLTSASALSIPHRPDCETATSQDPSITCQSVLEATTTLPDAANLFQNPIFQGSGEALPSEHYSTLSLPPWSTTGMVALLPQSPDHPWTKHGPAVVLNTGYTVPNASISQLVSGLSPGKYYQVSWTDAVACNSMVDWPIEQGNCTFTITADGQELHSQRIGHGTRPDVDSEHVWQTTGPISFQATAAQHDFTFITTPHFAEDHMSGGSTWRFKEVRLTGPWDSPLPQ